MPSAIRAGTRFNQRSRSVHRVFREIVTTSDKCYGSAKARYESVSEVAGGDINPAEYTTTRARADIYGVCGAYIKEWGYGEKETGGAIAEEATVPSR